MPDASLPDGIEADELRRLAERSQAIAGAILQAAVDPIIVIDPRGTIVDANRATTELFGYPREELAGKLTGEEIMKFPSREGRAGGGRDNDDLAKLRAARRRGGAAVIAGGVPVGRSAGAGADTGDGGAIVTAK